MELAYFRTLKENYGGPCWVLRIPGWNPVAELGPGFAKEPYGYHRLQRAQAFQGWFCRNYSRAGTHLLLWYSSF